MGVFGDSQITYPGLISGAKILNGGGNIKYFLLFFCKKTDDLFDHQFLQNSHTLKGLNLA